MTDDVKCPQCGNPWHIGSGSGGCAGTPTPAPAASERRGPFEVDTRPERIFEIRALAEVRAFGNGSGADMALRDLLALVDKQAGEMEDARRRMDLAELSIKDSVNRANKAESRIQSLERELAEAKRAWRENAEQMRKFADDDAAEWQRKLDHEVRCYQALLEDRDTLFARAETARAEAVAFLVPIITGSYRGSSNFAIADIEGFRAQQQAAKALYAKITAPAVEKE